MRKGSTFNQGFDENLICRSLEFFATKKIGMTLFVYCLLSGVAHAECVPTPDCESIGYTETSCEGGFVRCPFDISKLLCMPCDNDYKYDCSGIGYFGGTGPSCNGKYVECTCASGYEWNDGICKQNCSVGMFYYSDKSCSSTYNSSKTAIGVVVKDNELVLSQRSSSTMAWGTDRKELSLTNYGNSTDVKDDFNGKSNTATIIAEDSGAEAAKYCNDYTTAGTSAGDWYLPAAGELYSYVYGNYDAINTAMTTLGWNWGDVYLWSSSEYSYIYAWHVNANNGTMNVGLKGDFGYFSCFLQIN